MRRGRSIWLVATMSFYAACAPSRATLFDPVRQAAYERTRIKPEWRPGSEASAAAARRVNELLGKPLTAESTATIAVLMSPDLQASYEQLNAQGASVARAWTPSNPEVEAELVWPKTGSGEGQLELTALQNVTDLLAIVPRVNVANAELRALRRSAVLTTVDLVSRARTSYYQAVAAEQLLALRKTIAEAGGASAELARKLHEAGNLTDFDLARETIFEEEALVDVREAEANARAARENLNAVLGLQGKQTEWKLAAELPRAPAQAPSVNDLEQVALAASLDLEVLRARLEGAGSEIGLARLQSFLPDVGVGVAVKKEDEWLIGPAIALSIPVFDWGQSERGTAWAKLRSLQHKYTGTAVAVRARARAIQARAVAAHQRAVRMQDVVMPMREKLIDEAVLQYNAMNLSPFELLVLRREQVEAERRYIAALLDYWIVTTEVEQLRAGSIPGTGSGNISDGSGAAAQPRGEDH